jgi:hypothetical protein
VKKAWGKVLGREPIEIPAMVLSAIAEGLDIFDVRYISPAKRFMQSEKLQGLMTVGEFITAHFQTLPGLSDNFNVDEMAADLVKYSGAPSTILRTEDDVKKLRAAMAEQQKQAQEIESAKQLSEVMRNGAQAKATMGAGQA